MLLTTGYSEKLVHERRLIFLKIKILQYYNEENLCKVKTC